MIFSVKKCLFSTLFLLIANQAKAGQVNCVDLSSKSTPMFFWQAIKKLGKNNKALNECIKEIVEKNKDLNEETKDKLDKITDVDLIPITRPGIYFPGDRAGSGDISIVIASDDVIIDLCGQTIPRDTISDIPIIVILDGYENITIRNGTLVGNDKINDGIFLEGSAIVSIENMRIVNCKNGIGIKEATQVKVRNCIFEDCNQAVALSDTQVCTFTYCEATNCKEAGFTLTSSSYNTFKSCKALSTGNGENTEKSATAFSSSDGTGNIFFQCTAEGTFKENSHFGYNATGFLLNPQERGTKIIDCIANSTQCAGNGNAYGVHLDMVLKNEDDVETIHRIWRNENLYGVSWSPNSEYIAVGGEILASHHNLAVLDAKSKHLGIVATELIPETRFDEIKWSPNGQFLATSVSQKNPLSNIGIVAIYEFDANAAKKDDRLKLIFYTFTSLTNMYFTFGIDWSPDGKYLAILYVHTNRETHLALLHFDRGKTAIIEDIKVAAYAPLPIPPIDPFIGDVSFSPDGKKIALVHNAYNESEAAIVVYRFNPFANIFLEENILQLEEGERLPDFNKVQTIDFSPIACSERYFIAVGGQNKTKIFSLAADLTPITEKELADVNALKWSTNGKYVLAVGGDHRAMIYEFNYSESQSSLDRKISITHEGEKPFSCDWSPDGKNIIVVSSVDPQNLKQNIFIYEVGNVVEKCIIKNNIVSNTTGGLCGLGIEGAGGENLIMNNKGYENNINFSWGIYNHFIAGLDYNPKKLDNISVPLYFSGLAVKS